MAQENIHPAEIPNYIQTLQFEAQQLKAENENLKGMSIVFEKFYNVEWTLDDVARHHGIHKETVRRYVKAGLIPTHPKTTDGKIFIRASIGMQLDFELLRKQYRAL